MIASIVEREESLRRLLAALDKQTLSHYRFIIGAGYENAEDIPPATLREWEPEKLGCGNRWVTLERRVLEGRISPDTIVINIDDDLHALPHAIETTVREFEKLDREKATVLAYAGVTPAVDGFLAMRQARPDSTDMATIKAQQIVLFPACVVAMRAKHIVGVTRWPDSQILLGPYGDDEVLLAYHFAHTGVRMMRAGELMPYTFGPAYKDEHALWRHPKTELVAEAQRRAFKAATGHSHPPGWFMGPVHGKTTMMNANGQIQEWKPPEVKPKSSFDFSR